MLSRHFHTTLLSALKFLEHCTHHVQQTPTQIAPFCSIIGATPSAVEGPPLLWGRVNSARECEMHFICPKYNGKPVVLLIHLIEHQNRSQEVSVLVYVLMTFGSSGIFKIFIIIKNFSNHIHYILPKNVCLITQSTIFCDKSHTKL